MMMLSQLGRAVVPGLIAIAFSACSRDQTDPPVMVAVSDTAQVLQNESIRSELRSWEVQHSIRQPTADTIEVTARGGVAVSRGALYWYAVSRAAEAVAAKRPAALVQESWRGSTDCFFIESRRVITADHAAALRDIGYGSVGYRYPYAIGNAAQTVRFRLVQRRDGSEAPGRTYEMAGLVDRAHDEFERLRGPYGKPSREARIAAEENISICRDFGKARGIRLRR